MRYRLEYHLNKNCLTIHIDKVLTTDIIELFENSKWNKDKQATFVQEIFQTVPGIQCIILHRYDMELEKRAGTDNAILLKKGVVFTWEEIIKKALEIIRKHLDSEAELKEIIPPLTYYDNRGRFRDIESLSEIPEIPAEEKQ